jgi:hypothetical protein
MLALEGKQIAERWPIIKSAIRLSAMPTADTNDAKMNNILKALLDGRAVCWMTGNKRRPRTIIITILSIEGISQTKNLLVYCAHGFEKEKSEQYLEMLRGIKNYAINLGCDNIISYVGNDKLLRILKDNGAECDYTLVVFPLIN